MATPFEDYRVREYLSKVEWPVGLKVDYSYRPTAVAIQLHRNNFKWLDAETVVKTAETVGGVVTHIRLLGHECFLEAIDD